MGEADCGEPYGGIWGFLCMNPLSWAMGDWLIAGCRLPSDCTLDGLGGIWVPGIVAGERGPVREVVALAGEPAGDGEGPRMPGRWGEVWGEKGDWARLLCSPWLLDTPEVLTPGLREPSVPVGRSSMEPERSCRHTRQETAGPMMRRRCGKTPA